MPAFRTWSLLFPFLLSCARGVFSRLKSCLTDFTLSISISKQEAPRTWRPKCSAAANTRWAATCGHWASCSTRCSRAARPLWATPSSNWSIASCRRICHRLVLKVTIHCWLFFLFNENTMYGVPDF